jgi:hypothetical protein
MKKNIIYFTVMLFGFVIFNSCTSDFEEINTNPTAITKDEASGAPFLTKAQYGLFAPNRYPYWRAQLIHADRYAGYFCFGFNGSWWDDGLGYSFNGGYTDATYDYFNDHFGVIDNFIGLTGSGGDFENELMYAVGLIMKSLYYQNFTDVFGMIPYSQAGDPNFPTPKFDLQKEIYQGIITDLTTAIAIIGDSEKTGVAVEDLGDNDLFFKGDLQKWKRFANTLKLRVALRAHGAPDAGFADAAINEALAGELLGDGDDVLLAKDNDIDQWTSASYGDVWHNFGGLGSKWKVGKTLIDFLRDNNDTRLAKYAKPVPAVNGDKVKFTKPTGTTLADYQVRVGFILSQLDDAGVTYTVDESFLPDSTFVTLNDISGKYIGQPSRLNGDIYTHVKWELFSDPNDFVIGTNANDNNIFPEIVMSSAESYYLQTEAALLGFGSGSAQALFHKGIESAFSLWNATPGEYLSKDVAMLSGSLDENLEKLMTQRWVANYTAGFEGWAVARKSGYPLDVANGVPFDEALVYSMGDSDLNGKYPRRMKYGSSVQSKNSAGYSQALSQQGADGQGTRLWWNPE